MQIVRTLINERAENYQTWRVKSDAQIVNTGRSEQL